VYSIYDLRPKKAAWFYFLLERAPSTLRSRNCRPVTILFICLHPPHWGHYRNTSVYSIYDLRLKKAVWFHFLLERAPSTLRLRNCRPATILFICLHPPHWGHYRNTNVYSPKPTPEDPFTVPNHQNQ